MIGQAIRDLRHASRMILRMPALAAVVIGSLGVGIGANTIVFSWIQAVVVNPIRGVRMAAGFQLIEPKSDAGMYPGRLVARVPRPARAAARARRPDRVPHDSSLRRRDRTGGAIERAARLRQLFLGARAHAGPRPFPQDRRSGEAGDGAGRRDLARLLADALRRLCRGARADHPRQRRRRDHRRRRAARVQGDDPGAHLRLLAAGDDGAGTAEWIERADRPHVPRLHDHRHAGARRRARAGAERDRRGHAATRAGLSADQPQRRGGRASVLAIAARAAEADGDLARHPPAPDAVAAAGGVRQYREPRAGTRELATAGDVAPARARRRTMAGRQPAADGESAARAGRRGARRRDCVLGHHHAQRDAAAAGPRHPDLLRDPRRRDVVRLHHRAGPGLRPDLRPGAGAAARAARSAAVAARRAPARRRAAGCATPSWRWKWRSRSRCCSPPASSCATSCRRATRAPASSARACCSPPTISRAATSATRRCGRSPRICWIGSARCRGSSPRPWRRRCRWTSTDCRCASSRSRGGRGPTIPRTRRSRIPYRRATSPSWACRSSPAATSPICGIPPRRRK